MSEIRVMKNEYLPPMTMIVSPDLFQLLSDTPGQAASRREQIIAQFANVAAMMKRAVSGAPKTCQQPQAHPARCGCEDQS